MGKPGAKGRSRIRPIFKSLTKFAIALIILQLVYVMLLKWVDPPMTFTQFDSVLEGRDFNRDYVDLDEISLSMKLAVIAAEDQRFAEHNGFDWNSIEKTLEHNLKKKNGLRGASTISQQVAKNVFLWQERSWIRKGLEAYFTVFIEFLWSKERILEVYLNVAEMGPGVFGIEAAAKYYFNVKASKLNRWQAAQIAAGLPNPKAIDVKNPSKRFVAKTKWVKHQMGILENNEKIRELLE